MGNSNIISLCFFGFWVFLKKTFFSVSWLDLNGGVGYVADTTAEEFAAPVFKTPWRVRIFFKTIIFF